MAVHPSDIVVVGAGIIGCAVAYELARRGASVEVVDMRDAGQGATQAAAGMLAPYVEAHEESPLLELAVRSLELYDQFIAGVSRDSGQPIPYKRAGTLEVAADDNRMHRLRATADALSRRGVDANLLDADAARAEEPHLSRDVIGGLLIPSHGCVSAPILVGALASAARRHGAQILGHGAVRRVARDGDGILVETDRGTLNGDGVVIAAGSWSGSIEIEGVVERVPVRPVRGQLLQLRWAEPPLKRITWSERCYLVPWDDGTVLVGATAEEAGFDERATTAGVHDLIDAACEVVPRGWTAGFLGARVGLRPASTDGPPIIGASRVVPNLMYATAHHRNGVLLAPVTAVLVADAMLDNRVDALLGPVSPLRFGNL
ncbi:MAG: glycine oxidase ThiO [Acidobacteria bacterium]|nr:glycine oxidase ThiO [Acidobacteriota bacterium]